MRILFLSHYFAPEGNAPATRVFELTRRWVEAGHRVTVITGVPNVPDGVPYPGYRNRPCQRERVAGVDVIRVYTYLAANRGSTRRIVNYLSYMLTAALASLFVTRPDVVIATSPQFFCGWAGVLAARLRRVPLVLEVRDLWPESIVAVGAMRASRLIRILEWLERKMYAAARVVVTVGEGYRRQLLARGVPAAHIEIIPNGVDVSAFSPREDDGALRARLGLGHRFVCAYVGTIGMGSGLAVALRAARLLKAAGRDDVRLLLVGDGAVRQELEAEAREGDLDAVVFTGRLPKSRIPEVLAAADACLVHLRRSETFQTVIPSKIYEAASMHCPIVLGVEGSAAALVEDAGAGICIEPENEHELIEAIDQLARDPARAERLGAAGAERIAARHDYGALATRYAAFLEGLVADSPAPGR